MLREESPPPAAPGRGEAAREPFRDDDACVGCACDGLRLWLHGSVS